MVATNAARPTGYHLQGAPLAPASLSLPLLIPLRHAGDGLCLCFLPEMCIGSPFL